jgi:hypothetical protein
VRAKCDVKGTILMQARGGPMVQIPLTEPSNWITLLGWIDQ